MFSVILLDLPADLRDMEAEINSDLQSKHLEAVFSVTSYNYDTQAFTYTVMPKNNANVASQAQKLVDKHIKDYRNSRPGSFPYR